LSLTLKYNSRLTVVLWILIMVKAEACKLMKNQSNKGSELKSESSNKKRIIRENLEKKNNPLPWSQHVVDSFLSLIQ